MEGEKRVNAVDYTPSVENERDITKSKVFTVLLLLKRLMYIYVWIIAILVILILMRVH